MKLGLPSGPSHTIEGASHQYLAAAAWFEKAGRYEALRHHLAGVPACRRFRRGRLPIGSIDKRLFRSFMAACERSIGGKTTFLLIATDLSLLAYIRAAHSILEWRGHNWQLILRLVPSGRPSEGGEPIGHWASECLDSVSIGLLKSQAMRVCGRQNIQFALELMHHHLPNSWACMTDDDYGPAVLVFVSQGDGKDSVSSLATLRCRALPATLLAYLPGEDFQW